MTAPQTPPLLASVLDRLLDDDPRTLQEAPGACRYDLRRHKRAVARDLEALLNVRRTADRAALLEGFPQARDSFLEYGITDLAGLSLLNPDHRQRLREQIRQAIQRHEPRLAQVRVHLDPARDATRTLRFRVEALLELHPHRPPVVFDALLQLSSNACQVRSEA
jgi:type VI secretion system protein ImpF